jgi:hypothetical protein
MNELIRVDDTHGKRHYLNLDHLVEVAVHGPPATNPTVHLVLATTERGGEPRCLVVGGETATALLAWLDARATAIPPQATGTSAWGRQRDASPGDMAPAAREAE